jgi:ketosteroid isomerase-like protein
VTVREWIERYVDAWRSADAGLVSRLFAEDGEYCFDLFEEPARGRDGIAAYWNRVCSTQSDVDVRFGTPVLEGPRTVVEFWTTMKEAGEPVTLTGCMLLTFTEEGLCSALREYWIQSDGTASPPAFWGDGAVLARG